MVSDAKRLHSDNVESYKTAESFGVYAKRRSGSARQRAATANKPQRQDGSLDLSDPVFSKYLKNTERRSTDSSKPTRSTLDKFRSLIRRSRGQGVVDILKPEDAKSEVTSEYERAVTAEDLVTVQDVTTGKLYRVPGSSRRVTGISDSSSSKYHNALEDSRRLTEVPGSSQRFVDAVETSSKFSGVIPETSSKIQKVSEGSTKRFSEVGESSGRFASASEGLRSTEMLESLGRPTEMEDSRRFAEATKTSSRSQEISESTRRFTDGPEGSRRSTHETSRRSTEISEGSRRSTREASRRSTDIPEASRRDTEILEGSRRSTEIEDSGRFSTAPKTSSRSQEISDSTRRFTEVPEASRRSTHEASRRSTEFPEASRSTEILEGSRRSTEIEDSERFSQAPKTSSRSQEISESSRRFTEVSKASRRSTHEASRRSTGIPEASRSTEILEGSRRSTKIEDSRRFSQAPKTSSRSQEISESSKRFTEVPEASRRSTHEALRRSAEIPESSRSTEASQASRRFTETPEASRSTEVSQASRRFTEIPEASRSTEASQAPRRFTELPEDSRSTEASQASRRFTELPEASKYTEASQAARRFTEIPEASRSTEASQGSRRFSESPDFHQASESLSRYTDVPETSRRFTEVSEESRRLASSAESSRRYTEVAQASRRFSEVADASRKPPEVLEMSEISEASRKFTEVPVTSRRFSEASEASKKTTSEVPEISSRYQQDVSEASRRRSNTEASRGSTRRSEVLETSPRINEVSEESRRFTDAPQVVRDYQNVSGTSDGLTTVPEDSRRFTEISGASRFSEPVKVSRLVESSEPPRKFAEPCEPSSGVTAAPEASKEFHDILEASRRFTGSVESSRKCEEAPKTSRRSTAEQQTSSRFQEVYANNKEKVESFDQRPDQRQIPEESSKLAASTCQENINEASLTYQRSAKDSVSTHRRETKDSAALRQRKSKECSSVQQRDGKESSSRHRSIAKQASSTAYTRKSSRASTRCRGQSVSKYTKSPERSSRSSKSSKVCKPCRHVKADNRRMTGNVNIYICSEGNDAGSCNATKKSDSPCNSTSEDNPSCTCSSTVVCLTPSSSAIKMTSNEAKEPVITSQEAVATRPIEQPEQLFNHKTLSIVPQIGGSEDFGLCDVSSFGHVSTTGDSSKNLSDAKLTTWDKADCESIRREDSKSERSRSRSSSRNALARSDRDSGIYHARSKFTTCTPAPRCYERAPNYPDTSSDKFTPCRCPDPDDPRDDVLAKRRMSRSQENNRIPTRSELICNCCSYEGFDVPSGERPRDFHESAYNPSEHEVWQAPRFSSRSANYNGDSVSKKTTFSCDVCPKTSVLSNRLSNKRSTSKNMHCGLVRNSSTNNKGGRNGPKSDSWKENSAMKVSRTRADCHSTRSVSENESFQLSSSARATRSSNHHDSVKSILRNESGEQRSLRQSCDSPESKTSAVRDVEARARSNSSGVERGTPRENAASSRTSGRRMVAEKPNESRRSSSKVERSWVATADPTITASESKHDPRQHTLVKVVESSPKGVQDRPPNSTQIPASALSTTSKSPVVTCQANSGIKAKSAAEVPRKSSLKWPFSKTKSLISSYRQNRQSKKDSCTAEYSTSGGPTGPVSSTTRSTPRDPSLRTTDNPKIEASSRPDQSVNSAALEQPRKRHRSNGKNRPSSSSTLAVVLADTIDSKQSNVFDVPTQTSGKLRTLSGSDVAEADSCVCQCPQCCRSNVPREESSYERTRNSWQKPSKTDHPKSPDQLSSRGEVVRVCRWCCRQPMDCRCNSPLNRLSREPSSDSCSKSLSESDSLGPKSQICLYCDQPQEVCICRAPIKKCSYCGMLLDVCNCNEVLTACTTCGLNGQTCQCNGRLIQNPDDEGDPGICVTAWKPRRDVRKYFSREPDDPNLPDCTCCVSGKPYGSEELPYQRLSAFSDVMSELQQKMSEMSCDQCGKRPCCCCFEPTPTYSGFSSSAIKNRPYSSNIRSSRSRSPAPYRACSEMSPRTPTTCKIPLQICDRCRTSPCRCRRSRSSQNKPGAKCYYCKFTPCRCEIRNTLTPRSCMCIETPSSCRLEMTVPQIKKNLSSLSAHNQARRFCPCGSPRCRISRGQSRRLSENYRAM